MFFGRIVSLLMAQAAVLGTFVEIPIISNYAFWVLVGAYLVWAAAHRPARGVGVMLSIVLLLAAILGVFVEMPIVSNYAFWVMAANYFVVVAGTGPSYFVLIKK
jgi:hypothetical protein